MNREELLSRIWGYLQEHHQATVATAAPAGHPEAGEPHAATVFYALDSHMRLVFLSKATSRHAEHIKAGSRVALTVAGMYEDWREIQGIQLWGTARPVKGADRVRALAAYHRRFPFVQALLRDPGLAARLSDLAVFVVEPERAALTDNRAGPFGREQLDLRGERPQATSAIVGKVVSGRQEAAGFIQIPWVRDRLASLLGRLPFPGTLNLQLVQPDALQAWAILRSSGTCLAVPPGEDGFCPASFFPVTVNGLIQGGVILPHVPEYPGDILEIVAGDSLRDRLGLADDDQVELTW